MPSSLCPSMTPTCSTGFHLVVALSHARALHYYPIHSAMRQQRRDSPTENFSTACSTPARRLPHYCTTLQPPTFIDATQPPKKHYRIIPHTTQHCCTSLHAPCNAAFRGLHPSLALLSSRGRRYRHAHHGHRVLQWQCARSRHLASTARLSTGYNSRNYAQLPSA